MKFKSIHAILIIVMAVIFSYDTHADKNKDGEITIKIPESGFVQMLITGEGSRFIGRIIQIEGHEIEFETSYGIFIIPKSNIQSIREIPETAIRKGKLWLPDSNRSRLFFSPTGRMIPKGGGYFADYYIFFPSVNYGVSEKISLGGGFSLFPTGNMKDQVYFFTPKFSLKQTERLSFAAGTLMMKFPGDEPLVNLLYGVGTYGTTDHSVTFALGYGMVGTDIADKPMVVLGGHKRISRRTAFITENWLIPAVDNAIISYGIRFFGEQLSVDLALLNITGSDAVFPGIPFVDFVYNFGKVQ